MRVTVVAFVGLVSVLAFVAAHNSAHVSVSLPMATTSSSGTSIQMNRIVMIPTPARQFLSAPQGFDFDHDGQREFIIRTDAQNGLFEFYESIADNTFVLVHVLDLENNPSDSYYPADAGDIDDDGLADLVILALDNMAGGAEYGTRVYESGSTDTYPTDLVWEDAPPMGGTWWFGGRIADTDGDGKQDIVVVQPVGPKFVVYENNGNDSYDEVFSEVIVGDINTGQSFGLLSDLDNDGRDEALYGGAGPGDEIVAFESIGDDDYEVAWTWNFLPQINVQFIVDAGDLDGDGKKEFLAGGLGGASSKLHVFEAVSDNEVEIVATLTQSNGVESYTAANVADVDGDGRKEIVFATTWIVSIHENTGDNTWQEVWSKNFATAEVGPIQSIGAGDHDGDGKDEIIFRSGGFVDGYTSIWEISPADAADMDGDDVVDVIDNCPVTSNPGQQDADSDTVGDLCDNCIYGFNPTQGQAIFGQDVEALDPDTFSWDDPAEVVVASGDLSLVSTYIVDLALSLPLGTSFMDSSVPSRVS